MAHRNDVSFTIQNGGSFHSYISRYQRVAYLRPEINSAPNGNTLTSARGANGYGDWRFTTKITHVSVHSVPSRKFNICQISHISIIDLCLYLLFPYFRQVPPLPIRFYLTPDYCLPTEDGCTVCHLGTGVLELKSSQLLEYRSVP